MQTALRALADRVTGARGEAPTPSCLWSGVGLTRSLLENGLGVRLDIRVLAQQYLAAARLPGRVRRVLAVGMGDPVLLRCSELVCPGGRTVSRNLVIAPCGRGVEVVLSATPQVSLGTVLQRAGLVRRVCRVGRCDWPPDNGREETVFRHYVVTSDEYPVVFVEEIFVPALRFRA